MTIKIELPKELERELSDEASRLGLPLSEYVERLLATGRTVRSMPATGVDLVSYWRDENIIGSRSDIGDGQERARQLRARADRRLR